MEAKCENIPIAEDPASAQGQEALRRFAQRETIDLVVIGPELPLANGVADTLRDAGFEVIGPGKEAAQLEASKIYSKTFMAKYGIRAAKGSDFTDIEKARAFAVEHFNPTFRSLSPIPPLVIKADGLAAGKGVIIAHNSKEAESALNSLMLDKSLGDAGDSVLLEEFLVGKEVSVLAAVSVTGGKGFILPFIPARDHKRRFEGARGPNTGGMGSIAPVPDFSPAAQDDFRKSILEPTLAGMKAEGMDYRGFIFFGLMVREDRCYLLEYNVRLGDPETQAVLPLADFDLVDLCTAITTGKEFPLTWKPGAVCAPVAVADGYPGSYRKGDVITINTTAFEKTGARVFVSGAAASAAANAASGKAPSLVTTGGRVLTVSAYGANADEARAIAYQGMATINFSGMGFRRDIGTE